MQQLELVIDLETRSAVTELKKTGPWPYAEHPSTSVICLAYKLGHQPTQIWRPGEDATALVAALGAADVYVAHNVQFEQAVWHHVLHKRHGLPELPVQKLRDTAAVAAMHALPRPLGQACDVMCLPVQKDAEGQKLMLRMCKPRAPRKAEWGLMDKQFGGRPAYHALKGEYHLAKTEKLAAMCLYATRYWEPEMAQMLLWHEDPADIERLCQYCIQDVEAEYALGQALGELPALEMPVFQHDLIVQRRGIKVDVGMAHAALGMIEEHEQRLLAELDTLTSGIVRSPKQIEAGRKWLASRGLQLDDMRAETVKSALKGDLDPAVLRFLQIRQSLGKSSTAKFEAALHQTCSDGRLRGFGMYHGAATGRWTGKGIQLQNLPRGVFDLGQKPDKDGRKPSEEAFWRAVDIVRRGGLDELVFEFGDPMPILSSVIRPLLIAEQGHELMAADFSAIEGRGLAWLAGEEWVLDAYRAYDRGEGPDMYIVTASKILDKPTDQITKAERKNPGKPGDLGCFGPDTRVLTSNGIKRIAEVSLADRLWDGVEWVQHDGLIAKGEKAVIDLCGVEVTPDHLIRTGATWTPAQQLASNASTLLHAQETGSANLPSSALSEFAKASEKTSSATSGSSAPAARNRTSCTRQTCGTEDQRGAILALRRRAGDGGRGTTAMPTSAPMMSIAGACSTDSPHVSADATTRETGPTPTMEAAEYGSTKGGGTTDAPSSSTPSRSTAGITPPSNLTASTWTEGTSRETCASSPKQRTPETSDPYKSCSSKSSTSRPVFDILNSGPRNRFTIYSDKGPLLVHNCGYQGGYNALSKFGAAVPVDLKPYWTLRAMRGLAAPETREVLDPYIEMVGAGANLEHLAALQAQGWPMPSEEDIFQAWGTDVVTKWRKSRPLTVALWKGLEAAAIACVETGQPQTYGPVTYRMEGCFCTCELPSGRKLYYPFPRVVNREMPWGGTKAQFVHMTVDAETKQWVPRFAHGGLLAENITQATCRDVLAPGLIRLEVNGFPIVLHVHDEAVGEVLKNTRTLEEFIQILTVVPPWAAGFPISASGWVGERYRKD